MFYENTNNETLASSLRGTYPTRENDIRSYRYQGPPIVNEYELQKELMFNGRKNDDEKEDYEVLRRRCQTGHFQGTKDEEQYYRVAIPSRKYIRGQNGVKEPVWETGKMFFKDLFQYLKYVQLKTGPEPREDYFDSEIAYKKAYETWETIANRKLMLAKGVNWETYLSKNPHIADYIRRYQETEKTELEERARRREMQQKKKRLLISPALVKFEDEFPLITV